MPQASYNVWTPPVSSDAEVAQTRTLNREEMNKRKLNNIFGKHLDPAGNLNERGFYQDIAGAGVDPEQAAAAIKWYQTSKQADVSTQQANQQLRNYGADPNAGGRNGAQIGEPQPTYDAPAPTQPQDKMTDFWNRLRGRANPMSKGQPVASSTDSSAAEAPPMKSLVVPAPPTDPTINKSDALGKFLGMKPSFTAEAPAQPPMDQQAQLTAQAPIPADPFAPDAAPATDMGSVTLRTFQEDPNSFMRADDAPTLRPGVDNRSARQKVEDSYQPQNSAFGQVGQNAQSNQPDPALFAWNPANDGSNAYNQYSTALGAMLNSNGFRDASSYLQQVYGQTLQSNMPTPPNEGLLALGPEGQAKYMGEQKAYQAGLQQAQGKAIAAVTEARGKLSEFAQKYGVNTVEQRKTEIGPELLLRDPAKRNEAAALLTNTKNIDLSKHDLQLAGTDGAKLMLVAPSIIRAYTTALNPGQQLSEGNLKESAMKLFPEFGSSEEMLGKAVLALGLYMKDDDRSGIDAILSQVTQSSPVLLQRRLARMADEASQLNSTNLSSYVMGKPPESKGVVAEAPDAPAPTKTDALGDLLGKNKKSENTRPAKKSNKANKSTKSGPKVGDVKTFPNGRKAKWDGTGWGAI